jgi:hypothetical protein
MEVEPHRLGLIHRQHHAAALFETGWQEAGMVIDVAQCKGAEASGNRIARVEETARTRFLAETFVFHSQHFLVVFVSHSGDFSTHWSREKSVNETPALFRSSDELAYAKFDQIDHANCPL